MPQRHMSVRPDRDDGSEAELRARFDAIRAELEVPEAFPDSVLAEAADAMHDVTLPDHDATDVDFITIDPPGSMDLDQALHIERMGDGYRVRYAIADVAAFVAPGGAIDVEARKRGQTVYAPDGRTPLHPPELSEGAASLLPEETRPAYVWDMRLGPDGEGFSAEVRRSMVRSRARYDYAEVDRLARSDEAPEAIALLKKVGELRIGYERRRGGASLPMPEQEVHEEDGRYRIAFRPPLVSEEWNAQISLMTGMAAAEMMIDAKVGVLRTMPAPDREAVRRFRRAAAALGVPWREDQRYGEFLRSLDRTDPTHLALVFEATTLFRGAGYTVLNGSVPRDREHAAVAHVYAHTTAPLRRLVDRFALETCEAISTDADVPAWVRDALPELPERMADSSRTADAVERACADAVEAALLRDRIGEIFPAVAVDAAGAGAVTVQIAEPAVIARATGAAEPGDVLTVRLTEASIATSTVGFDIVDRAAASSAARTG